MSNPGAAYKKDRDAFGHMLMDFQHGEAVMEIIEREDGYIFTSDHVGNYFSEFDGWAPEEQAGIQHLVPGRVLDLGCGAGRAGLYLQEQGHAVMGIDISPLAVEVCRQRGVKDAQVLSITQVGPDLGQFDNIIMLGNNWGLMGSRARAQWLLRRFYKMSSPTARIVACSNDVSQTRVGMHLDYQNYNRQRGRMPGQMRFRVCHRVWRSVWFDYLMVSRVEMEEILSGTGWHMREFIGSSASHYAAILEKEGA